MKRFVDQRFLQWKSNPERKSLLVRGARQVGKTYSVRELGKTFTYFLEVNFESDREVHGFFERNLDPDVICRNLSIYYNIPIIDGETLVFFDEIQACPHAISSLRFFYEKRPGLHLAGAGSMLEFALSEIPSFGVGRIEHLFMFPLSFDEFLIALNQEQLYELKNNCNINNPLNEPFHARLIDLLKQFLVLGGLPEVIKTFIETNDYLRSQIILDQIITGLNDDFAKYKQRVPLTRINEVFGSVVLQSGNKFNISRASDSASHKQTKDALELLEKAGLIFRVMNTAANGLPLGAEVNPRKYKIILFDHGCFQRILGLNLSNYIGKNNFEAINKGNLAEQFVGTELIKNLFCHDKPQLFYWHRDKRGSNAEVDYLIQKGSNILPMEVKAGLQGKMQSLRIFMNEKKIKPGIRISLENFNRYDNIQVFPLYAVKNIIDRDLLP